MSGGGSAPDWLDEACALVGFVGVERRAGSARCTRLSGGCVGEVHRVDLPDDRRFVVKSDPSGASGLLVEARMLEDLHAAALRVPRVLGASETLLVLEWLPGRSGAVGAAAVAVGRAIAALHGVTAPAFGSAYDTRIGGLVQPGGWSASWLEFFGSRRIGAMAAAAVDQGALPMGDARAIERLAERLGAWLDEPDAPALLHGDLWAGNVMTDGARLTGFVDPASSFGHPEAELAFTTLFGGFPPSFYDAYAEARGRTLDSEFRAVRADLYNLYPLLVHVRLFAGGGYVDDVRRIVRRFVGR